MIKLEHNFIPKKEEDFTEYENGYLAKAANVLTEERDKDNNWRNVNNINHISTCSKTSNSGRIVTYSMFGEREVSFLNGFSCKPVNDCLQSTTSVSVKSNGVCLNPNIIYPEGDELFMQGKLLTEDERHNTCASERAEKRYKSKRI